MPRSPDTIHAGISFNPHNQMGKRFLQMFQESSCSTLGELLKKLVYSVLGDENTVPPITFPPGSKVKQRLLEEANRLEMGLDEYIRLLLSDRDDGIYGSGSKKKGSRNLWFGESVSVPATEVEESSDQIDMDQALENAAAFLNGGMFDGF